MALREVLQPKWWVRLSYLNGAWNVSRKILMNSNWMLPIFWVGWHWMLKACIRWFITRVRSLQLCSMHATLAAEWKRASNKQQRGRPITTPVVSHGTQSQRDHWHCLKFHQCHNPQWSSFPKTKFLWCGSGQEYMDLCSKEVCDKKLSWEGQTFCTKRKSKLEKESTFFKQCGNHRFLVHQFFLRKDWCRWVTIWDLWWWQKWWWRWTQQSIAKL